MTRALFVVDAGAGVGFGHFRRSSFLFRAFQARGIDCRMIVPQGASLNGVWSEPLGAWPDDLAKLENADILVADSYRIDLSIMQDWKQRFDLRLMIDDNADRPLDADYILNHNIYAPTLNYNGMCSAGALTGLDYCLIDPRFAELRSRPLQTASRIVVSFGGSDMTRGLETATEILQADSDVLVDVILPAMPDGADTVNDPRLSVLVLPDMIDTMSRGTVYVGGAGVTTWEAAAAGLSIVVCRIADNQVRMIPALRNAGIRAFDDYDAGQLAQGAIAEMAKPVTGNPLSHIIDGQGAARAVDAVLGT